MVKVDIISGFLGAGKTTLIKKLSGGAIKSEKVALIENEFGEIGIDGAFLKETGIEIKEINSGCICCSLVGDFSEALSKLVKEYNPDRIIIEPSGVGKLSDVVKAVKKADENLKINVLATVVDGGKIKLYHKNFGEFYIDQIREADTVILSKIEGFSQEKIIEISEYIKGYNPTATIITTPLKELDGKLLLENLEDNASLVKFLIGDLMKKHAGEHHHEHHHEHDKECHCHDHEHHHEHHHEHDKECHCHDHEHHHEHHHEHDKECHCHDHECHCHHAEEVFESFAVHTAKSYSKLQLETALSALNDEKCGVVLRAKGVVKNVEGSGWLHFDFVPNSFEVRDGAPDVTGKICVIGSCLNESEIAIIFGVEK